MGRPRKNPDSVMSTDLRIPVTPDQKRLIEVASRVNPEGMAAWARAVLIRTANEQLAAPGVELAQAQRLSRRRTSLVKEPPIGKMDKSRRATGKGDASAEVDDSK